ncbi:MAG TPA: response regulator transcription factor [Mycobacteriales bacterium]|jgi:DNA-binding NarL/FixJ family response regulator|nr:response regulator transcription factor [Mycobacteriales bacterium]
MNTVLMAATSCAPSTATAGPAEPRPAAARARTARTRRTRVLVAEDAPGLHQLLCLLLEMEDDFEVVARAVDGVQTLAAAAAERPDLVVLDLGLPVMSGFDALTGLRRLLPDATIVVFSAFEAASYAATALRRGADAYVEKDAGALEIVQRLREACRR